LTLIRKYEKKFGFKFEDGEILKEIKELRDLMGKMWLYFKERHFKYAFRKINELSSLSLNDPQYREKINDYLNKMIPIFSIYELFNRSLVDSVYPESSPRTNILGIYLARFFTSKFNPIGIRLMDKFNELAYRNWSFLIRQRHLDITQFFRLILSLPIWKHVPNDIKVRMVG
jgi:hypothetical protein